ncbi:MAG: zinc-binding dehydrogenase [Alphaproteobacteria bacterium]|nr:zinc-binding dehydrogenase [Alphaproteobacteria bacterium]
MSADIPHTMRALRLAAYGERITLEVKQVPVPSPGPGQALVKVAAAPVHLDDVVFCQGVHAFRRALPTTPGSEGSGLVVAVGGGLVGRFLQGRRVAFAPRESENGTWAEYCVVDVSRCLPLWEAIDDVTASMLIVDPVTALSLVDEVRAGGHAGAVQTQPLGAVGRMILALGRSSGLPVIHVAQGPEEVAEVHALGGEQVLDGLAEDFDGRLRRATRAVNATALIDGRGGEASGRILAGMPDGAEAILYGLEPGASVEVDLAQLVYRRKRVRGFAFVDRASEQGTRSLMAQLPRLRRHADAFRQKVATRLSLEGVQEALRTYRPHRAARLVVEPGLVPDAPEAG